MRWQDEQARDLSLAWHVAALATKAFVGKLPDLRDLMAKLRSSQERPSLKQQRMQAALISDYTGIAWRQASPEALAALERLKSMREAES